MSGTLPNPVLPVTVLLRPQMPGVYDRVSIYDPTWDNINYTNYAGQRIVPYQWSIVHDTDGTILWVSSVDPVTFVPTYTSAAINGQNDNVVSLLNYGNTVLRLYVDYRALPYPAMPDTKCVFIGKSPRFYTLSRYPNTAQETIISQYFDATGKLVSQQVPLLALDANNNSWYLPRSNISVLLDDNEEVLVKIYGEDGTEVDSALLYTKQSAVINENVLYSPTILSMTISGNQQLANGTFFVYEKQDLSSLGLTATLVYDDQTTTNIAVDGIKCILYGQSDFISSFAGLTQELTVKYFRSQNETIAPGLSNPTGDMISVTIPVTVIPNTLGITNKIIAIPTYNTSLAQYIMRYWMYFADGRSHVDVSGYVTTPSGNFRGDSAYFGIVQSYSVQVDMSMVDPVHYPTQAIYQQNITVKFSPPTTLVKWTLSDSATAQYVYGQDTANARRPSVCYDATRKQYFIPSALFANSAAFINSFYTQSSPPYDPSVSQIPQVPTHFVIRDMITGAMLVAAPIALTNYAQAFTLIGDATGSHVGTDLMVEFLNVINSSTTNVLYGVPVNTTTGTYIGN